MAEARGSLESLARSKQPLEASAALLELGRLSAREGDFAASPSRWLERAAPALMNAFRRLEAGRPARAN